jgi:hypothetical protein
MYTDTDIDSDTETVTSFDSDMSLGNNLGRRIHYDSDSTERGKPN